MDDFSVFGSSFEECLHHLTLVLIRCKEKNLVLNLGEMPLYGQTRDCFGPCDIFKRY
jgi:hypothetical protein